MKHSRNDDYPPEDYTMAALQERAKLLNDYLSAGTPEAKRAALQAYWNNQPRPSRWRRVRWWFSGWRPRFHFGSCHSWKY